MSGPVKSIAIIIHVVPINMADFFPLLCGKLCVNIGLIILCDVINIIMKWTVSEQMYNIILKCIAFESL